MLPSSRSRSRSRIRIRTCAVALAATGTLLLASACGHQGQGGGEAAQAEEGRPVAEASSAAASATPSASGTGSPSASASPSAKARKSATPSPAATASASARQETRAPSASSTPDFPVPAYPGDATQLITVKSSGSYATVTAWAKGSAGWKAQFSTAAGRVGSNGVVDGATRRQNTYTTPSGTYTLTEGFGVEAGGTSMPYTVVNSSHWWVEDPESKFYNSMHTAAGADFPLTESGDRGSEHLVDHPVQYAKALVINFNRWPATPGRGAGIFLHINGQGATAGCVSVPRATMEQIMAWIKPGAHPRIAIG
ncbi:L,D-transpeptidase family protein [Streptomyces sp. TLI_185]|uniref:L,D-transpeptidase family protein n=1 Tax=Streptomyces sp. TLI_185 TaxID=2485151 RepID=UPI000FAFDB65|nr:L,D-transpeptidase family protein [Streptomyces sp. TLI_185]RPF35799.1 L,D-peptidoglycan transpeptidase YkuD (ErfK/YbiS/YcfS/YnhG family) [Streptomyces sp. TLI_185]